MNCRSALALTGILALCIPAQAGHTIHVDIEPHSLHRLWANNKAEISTEWLDLLTAIKDHIPGHALKADVAMSYAMEETTLTYGGKSAVLLEHAFDICDGTVLMAYRAFDGVSRESCQFIGNQDLAAHPGPQGNKCDPSKCPGEDNVMTHSAEAVLIAQKSGNMKTLGIALESNPFVNPIITMGALEHGEAAMERAIDDVTPLLANTLIDSAKLDLSIGVHDMVNYMRKVFIEEDPNVVVPADALSANVASNQDAGPTGRYCRFAWLWDTHFVTKFCDDDANDCDNAEKLAKKVKRQQMWDFTRAHGITVLVLDVFWLVDVHEVNGIDDHRANLKRFVLEAYENDVGIEFLFAGHHYASRENHNEVIVQVDKLVTFLEDLGPQPTTVSLNHDGSCKDPNFQEDLETIQLPKYDWAKDATCGFEYGEPDAWRTTTAFTRRFTHAQCKTASASTPQGRCHELVGYVTSYELQQNHIGGSYSAAGLTSTSNYTAVQR